VDWLEVPNSYLSYTINAKMQLPKAINIFWSIFWTLIVGLSLYFYIDTFIAYRKGITPENFNRGFLDSKIWFIGHIAGASASLLLGPIQFWDRFRKKYMNYHRFAGKIFIIGSLIAAICAFRLNLMYDCKPCRISLGMLSVLWFFTTLAAWWAIKNKNIIAHKQFMTRSYTAALAFVFIRLFPLIGYKTAFPLLDTSIERRTTAEWLCWIIPMIVVEMYMVWWPSLINPKRKRTSRAV
jgi:uncharacterized membrane protein